MVETFRVAVLLLGGFAFGLTLLVTVLYIANWRWQRTNGIVPVYHVPLIGSAHMALIAALMGGILQRFHHHDDFALWLSPLACIGFSLTIGALVGLLRSQRLRTMHSEVSPRTKGAL